MSILVWSKGEKMKKHKIAISLIAISLMLILSVSYSFAQGRKNEALPKIGETIRKLDKAIGWMKSPEGQWIHRQNRIPAYLSLEHKILLDYKEFGAGIDNFDFIELRSIDIEGQEYYMLIKVTRAGYYKYSSIHEGWTPKVHYYYFVFQKNEIDNIIIEKNTPKLIEIDVKSSGDIAVFGELSEKEMKQKISYNIKRMISRKFIPEIKLFLNLFCYDKNNVIRFLILSVERCPITNYNSYNSIAARYLNSVPNGKESLIQPDVFNKFYYECPLQDFKKLIPLVAE